MLCGFAAAVRVAPGTDGHDDVFNTLTAYAFRVIETVNRKMDLEIDNVDNVEQCAATDRTRKNVPSAWSRLIDRSAV